MKKINRILKLKWKHIRLYLSYNSYSFKIFVKKEIKKLCNSKYVDLKKNAISFQNNGFTSIYTCYNKCRDNFVGRISCDKEEWFIESSQRFYNKEKIYKIPFNCDRIMKRLVIVIESPHRDEFKKNIIAPALGRTGDKIHAYLVKLLNQISLLNNDLIEVYIVNIVQFQCSLGFDTNVFRDHMFSKLYQNEIVKRSFFNRIKKINPNIIINATTKIRNYKHEITELLYKQHLAQIIIEAESHPSMWNDNTKITIYNNN